MRWLYGLIILIALFSGVWLRWLLASNDPLWVDELHSSWVLSGRWSDIAARAIAGNQSPLYFWCCYPFVQSLGQSPLSLRLLSLVAGCLLLFVGTLIVWRRTGSQLATAVVAMGLAFESHLIFYSSEARPYALVQLGGLILAGSLFRRFENEDSGLPTGAILLTVLLVLLHPTAILLTCSIALLLFVARRHPQRWDGCGIVIASLVGVVINPAVPTWYGRRGLWSGLVDYPLVLGTCLTLLFAAWILPAILRSWMRATRRSRSPVAEPVFATDFAKLKTPQPAWYWLGCFLLPLLLALTASSLQHSGLATTRYLAAIWSFPAIGLGLMVFDLPRKQGWAVAAAGLFFLSFGGIPWRTPEGWELIRSNPLLVSLLRERTLIGQRNEGWAEIFRELASRSTPFPQPIWLYSNLIEDDQLEIEQSSNTRLREYLCFPLQGIYSVAAERLEPRALRATQLLRSDDVELLSKGEVWVVVRCAELDLVSLEEAWQRDWKTLKSADETLRVQRICTAGDVHLLSLIGTPQPRRAEQSD